MHKRHKFDDDDYDHHHHHPRSGHTRVTTWHEITKEYGIQKGSSFENTLRITALNFSTCAAWLCNKSLQVRLKRRNVLACKRNVYIYTYSILPKIFVLHAQLKFIL